MPHFHFVLIPPLWRPFSSTLFCFRRHNPFMATVFFASLPFSCSCPHLWRPFSSTLFCFRRHTPSMATVFFASLPFSSSCPFMATIFLYSLLFSSSCPFHGDRFLCLSSIFVLMPPLWRPFSSTLFCFRRHPPSMATVFFASLPFSSSCPFMATIFLYSLLFSSSYPFHGDRFLCLTSIFDLMPPLWRPFSSTLFCFRRHTPSMATVFFASLPFSSSCPFHGYLFLCLSSFFVLMPPLWRPFSSTLFYFRRHNPFMVTIFFASLPF
ncbi:N-acetyl-1-D-myo-inosityl-2-amino-2-deoxy-alpha- D-glucopyranoside deacetylase MshB [Bacillus sp. ZZV12-4809]|nr:N-acetyl-1-D-myo-inosityl-2-amino-2-deoxy-alpha- D-glucopyranoside deacetylase MshB [Bacillus sp. ZZV12-4809]